MHGIINKSKKEKTQVGEWINIGRATQDITIWDESTDNSAEVTNTNPASNAAALVVREANLDSDGYIRNSSHPFGWDYNTSEWKKIGYDPANDGLVVSLRGNLINFEVQEEGSTIKINPTFLNIKGNTIIAALNTTGVDITVDSYSLSASDITTTSAPGSATNIAHGDHTHKGVYTIKKTGDADIFGTITLSAGTNVSLIQSGNVITISATDTGEVNTASNVGTAGVGVFKQKSGVDLQFKKINAGSNKVSITDDTVNSEVDIDVTEANLSLNNLGGTLSIAKGGTGQTSATAAFNALDPLTTKGDLIVNNGTDSIRLPVGSNNQILTANSAVAAGVEWQNNLWNTNGTDVWRSSGKVGIGGTPSSYNLEIFGTNANESLNSSSTTGSAFYDARNDSGSYIETGIFGSANGTSLFGVLATNSAFILLGGTTTLLIGTNLVACSIVFGGGSEYGRFNTSGNFVLNNQIKISGGTPGLGKVLTSDATGLATWQTPSSGGEVNTASNVGTGGVGLFNSKVGVDLQFKNINAGSSKISITNDVANKEVDVDVIEANLSLNNLGGTLNVSKGGTGATTLTGVLKGNGTSAFTASNVNLASEVTGTLPIANGGTGQTTATAAFNALDPLTTRGDIIVYDGTNSVRLPVGTDGYVLRSNSAAGPGVDWWNPDATGYMFFIGQNSSDAESTTTLTAFQQKLRLTTTSLAAGTYRIGYSFEGRCNSTTVDFRAQVQINDLTTIASFNEEVSDATSFNSYSGFYYYTGSGVLDIDIDYSVETAGTTVGIRRARLEIWRVA